MRNYRSVGGGFGLTESNMASVATSLQRFSTTSAGVHGGPVTGLALGTPTMVCVGA